jgi:hypothetical protein
LEDDWMRCMRQGDLDGAWRLGDAVLRERRGRSSAHLQRHEQWIWKGTPLAGRHVLVRCYHGLGDTIQFIRYLPALNAIASRVTVWVQPQLASLVRRMAGAHRVLPLHDGAPTVDYDVDVEVMELPYVFRSSLRSLPARVPYLQAGRSASIARDGRLAVGLVWHAAGGWDARRSIAPSLVRSLADMPGVQLHLLQRGPALAACADLGIVSGSDDVDRAAGVMAALDLVISVDSMPAHLAGALGRPVWTLLHRDADWRWMEARDDSPWYPTMRLFRQHRAGDWGPVIVRVARELALAADRARPAHV